LSLLFHELSFGAVFSFSPWRRQSLALHMDATWPSGPRPLRVCRRFMLEKPLSELWLKRVGREVPAQMLTERPVGVSRPAQRNLFAAFTGSEPLSAAQEARALCAKTCSSGSQVL
jgi:hypothetical protein